MAKKECWWEDIVPVRSHRKAVVVVEEESEAAAVEEEGMVVRDHVDEEAFLQEAPVPDR